MKAKQAVPRVFLALGSNTGWRLRNLWEGIARLKRVGAVYRVSPIIETLPQGEAAQGPYLNLVLALSTDLSPQSLLRHTQSIERRVGRVPTFHWGPRTLDIDILIYNNLELRLPGLALPHPHIGERPFVLDPLKAIAPDIASRWTR